MVHPSARRGWTYSGRRVHGPLAEAGGRAAARPPRRGSPPAQPDSRDHGRRASRSRALARPVRGLRRDDRAARVRQPQFGGDEPHYLLTAESIVSDHDLDLRDEYAELAYRDWYPYVLERHGRLRNRQANEPTGAGFALLIAPAYGLGGRSPCSCCWRRSRRSPSCWRRRSRGGSCRSRGRRARARLRPVAAGAGLRDDRDPRADGGGAAGGGGGAGPQGARAAADPLGRGRRARARRAALAGAAVHGRRRSSSRSRCCAGCAAARAASRCSSSSR